MKALFRRERLAKDVDDEMDFHLSMREQWNVDEGMERQEARRDARVRFGSAVKMRERMGEIDVMTLPQTVLQDLRYGARMLVRQRRFTLAAVVALAVGIGANTAAFTAYKALIGRKLDGRDAGRMVNLSLVLQTGEVDSWFSYPDYEMYRDKMRSLTGVIVAGGQNLLTMAGAGAFNGQRVASSNSLAGRMGLLPAEALGTAGEQASVFSVSENYFSVLGVGALRGRTFDEESVEELRAQPAVMISENYWQRRFAGDPGVLGKTIRLHGAPFTIIGITPHDFVGTEVETPDFWMPMSLTGLVSPETKTLTDREDKCCRLYGRLADGATANAAQAEMTALANQLGGLHDAHSERRKPVTALVSPGSPFPHGLPGGLRFSIALIMVAVGMVLVIACANVASLQLARAAARQSELRMRLSLGASRGRLIRQLLTESALLAVVAGALALLVTWAVLRVAASVLAGALPAEFGVFVVHINPDLAIFGYVFAVSMVA
ncbi:MAG TPA: ABC transporter permease, partial [Acidobacteriaceae bacterium]|nr:ABC transporter permease [Acidobacteriaceae bacterium]